MTSMPPGDPLIALWRTGPKPDTHHVVQDLKRQNRLHQRLNRSVLAILCGVAILIMFEEFTGRVATHGALSAGWILVVILGLLRHRRARCNRSDAFTLDTVSLLKFMIAQAKSDLRTARWLYAGVPCGAVVGGLAMKLANSGATHSAAVDARLHLIQTAAGLATLIAMMVTGAILARSRTAEVRELSEKLRLIQAEL
jgi:hypothetical protein